MKAVATVVCMIVLASSAIAESFSLKDLSTGKTRGPFQFKDGSKVLVGNAELTIVKSDPLQDKIVAMLKAVKIPRIDFSKTAVPDVVQFLTHNAKGQDISMVLGRGATQADPITFSVRNTTLYQALGILCDAAGLKWQVRNGVVMIDVK